MPQSFRQRVLPAAAEPAVIYLHALRRLFRLELSALVALSAFAGYLFAGGRDHLEAFLVTSATVLLSAASSALNQYQEQDLDRLMTRTCMRPLPSGLLNNAQVLILAVLCFASGFALLHTLPYRSPLLLGLLTALWYNAVYTPLKRRCVFAALPGALCGALPPLIGWSATGAALLTQKSLILAGVLFVWQIPHTWLLLCCYRDDLHSSGLPDLFRTIPTENLLRINNCWLGSLLLAYLLFPLFNFFNHQLISAAYATGMIILFALMTRNSLLAQEPAREWRSFHLVNMSMALLLTTIIIDNLV